MDNRLIKYSEFPLYAAFCITSKCNAHCKHCSSGSNTNIKNDLTTDRIIGILEELEECGVVQVGLSGGEPLLHPDFDLIAKKAVSLGLSVGVGTNGSTINEDVIRRIKDIGIHRVQVSLDGDNDITHDNFRGINGLFQKAINSIEEMLAHRITVNVCMTPTVDNYTELEGLIDKCAEMGVKGFNLSQFVPTGRGTNNMDLPANKWKEILELWRKKSILYKDKMNFTAHGAQLVLVYSELKKMKAFVGCQAGKATCCIKPDGSVLPCVMLDIPIGNLKNNNFKDIWSNSTVIDNLRNRDLYGNPCKVCEHKDFCGGCRGVAYGVTGNYLGGDPRCWLHK